MATREEKQELIEILKFTPRTYKISMWGYGGEKVMGTVNKEVWDYCNDNQVDLQDIAWSDEDTVQDDMGLDLDKLPFPPGSWYECDDMGHINGVSRDAGTLQIEDENGNTVFEKSFDDITGGGCDGEPDWCCDEEVWVGSRSKGEVVVVGSSNEKGTFFEGEIELKQPFNIEKLELHYTEFDGEEIITSIVYDGEEIDNWGGSTDGKSSDFNMVMITDDTGSFERYAPGEKDWGHPEHGPSPSNWETSPKFKFSKVKPTIEGWYSAVWRSFGTTHGTLYWNGSEFGEWEFGQFKPVSGVDTWQGYNWDTSSWVNQPPEPPNIICTNKKCKWVGKSNERITDEEYNDHCPKCNGTDFDWIDYDPDTAKGRKNREKYCKDWDPVASLEKIVLDLGDQIGADPEEVAEIKQSGWPFGPAEKTEETEVVESKSKWWTVRTYYKKSCEQHEYFTHPDYDGHIVVKDGFRSCTYNVETNDGEFPKFEFTNCPGGSADLDSIDLNSCYGTNIESTELVEMFDGGCWGEWEFPDDMPEEEKERLEEFLSENGSYALEDEEGWSLDETEVWVWGPLEVSDDDGNTRIVVADESGNMVEFKDE